MAHIIVVSLKSPPCIKLQNLLIPCKVNLTNPIKSNHSRCTVRLRLFPGLQLGAGAGLQPGGAGLQPGVGLQPGGADLQLGGAGLQPGGAVYDANACCSLSKSTPAPLWTQDTWAHQSSSPYPYNKVWIWSSSSYTVRTSKLEMLGGTVENAKACRSSTTRGVTGHNLRHPRIREDFARRTIGRSRIHDIFTKIFPQFFSTQNPNTGIPNSFKYYLKRNWAFQ